MKGKFSTMALLLSFAVFFAFTGDVSAAAMKPKDILAEKYPNEVVKIVKTDDINNDKKKESFILTESGNFYLINAKGHVVLINTGIISDEGFEPPTIQVFTVSKNEKHVAVTFSYFPSNTQLYVYRLQHGTLSKALQLMGDQGVYIDSKGKVHQYWKNHRIEGGWDLAEGIFTWNTKTNKYKGSGKYVRQS
ncbi:hypothetical protein [Paenibacillus sp. JZ16]|uniref:hypothetical protein n=1 Tax=Paenibacillus sp. JZ16 TaxID=1906272 RepID=UPI00188A0B01|nr:hypothetical protein [Paenibacillus sp. JZ16]